MSGRIMEDGEVDSVVKEPNASIYAEINSWSPRLMYKFTTPDVEVRINTRPTAILHEFTERL